MPIQATTGTDARYSPYQGGSRGHRRSPNVSPEMMAFALTAANVNSISNNHIPTLVLNNTTSLTTTTTTTTTVDALVPEAPSTQIDEQLNSDDADASDTPPNARPPVTSADVVLILPRENINTTLAQQPTQIPLPRLPRRAFVPQAGPERTFVMNFSAGSSVNTQPSLGSSDVGRREAV